MKGLTEKQRNILNFIEDFMEVNVMAPTVYEIAEHFSIKTSTVFAHLRSLQKKNYMTRSSKARSINLTRTRGKTRRPNGICTIPVYEKDGMRGSKPLYYDSSILRNIYDLRKLFAIKVSDSSMNGAGILDGDLAILKKYNNNVHNGDIVLVEIDGKPELRTFHELDDDHIALTAASGTRPSIQKLRQEVPIRGILVGVQRSL
ncbi:MAG: hypothetical protein J5858_12165 [Lentisphaeria bacterium]|nr:hypothetical protein [Lentisphaeria bacterium]